MLVCISRMEFTCDVSLSYSLSSNTFSWDWAQLESGTFRFRDPLNKERRFLPLRLDDAPSTFTNLQEQQSL